MANPRPGQKGYSGPVGEGWGRPAQNFIDWANKSANDAFRSANDLGSSIDKSIRDGLNPATWGIVQDIGSRLSSPARASSPRRPATPSTGSNVGKGYGSRTTTAKPKAKATTTRKAKATPKRRTTKAAAKPKAKAKPVRASASQGRTTRLGGR
jgi:hypothetical protein